MTVATKLMTADEFLKLPGDGKRYELIEGVLRRCATCSVNLHSDLQKGALTPWRKATH